jgi:desulfoferrodoxin (superoxide reductase-like protein)
MGVRIMVNRRAFLTGVLSSPFFFFLKPSVSWANIPSVRLEAKGAGTGGQTEIIVHVAHKGNSVFHHVDRVKLLADGQEINRWEYSWSHLPPSENFSVAYGVDIKKETTFSALANCNLHGENTDPGDLKVSPTS